MIRVGILGATGYTARELIRVLLRHPQAEIVVLTSRQEGNPPVSAVHPQFLGRLDLELTSMDPAQIAHQTDCVFSCLPHAASAIVVRQLVECDVKVIDFSADYRLNDAASYEQWYGERHPDQARLGKVPYGLPELFREQIREAKLVANPGCYPTSVILPLAPLLRRGLIEADSIIIDSKSGLSGAGRTPKLTTHFAEANESVSPYNVGRHRHTPEIEQILGRVAAQQPSVVFTPHLVPMDRGILSSIYAVPTVQKSEDEWLEVLDDFYRDEPFVRVVEHLPATKDTMNSNYCDLTVRLVKGRLILLSAIDNLGKGASGAAVQNMNLMFELPEMTAL